MLYAERWTILHWKDISIPAVLDERKCSARSANFCMSATTRTLVLAFFH